MWRIEREDDYYRIFDSSREIAAYLDPDYGIPYDAEDASERVEAMARSGQGVGGAYVMVPMAKFGIFDSDYDSDIDGLQARLEGVAGRVAQWREFAASWPGGRDHHVRISHTDHDMLSITFYVGFGRDVRIEGDDLLEAVTPMLEDLKSRGLL
ncbi:MAG: hypothetical protein OXU85_07250 [Thaumarchaeota archaeon]|nr:hypothetical protein [Nitrososphaerota archaeon]